MGTIIALIRFTVLIGILGERNGNDLLIENIVTGMSFNFDPLPKFVPTQFSVYIMLVMLLLILIITDAAFNNTDEITPFCGE